MCTRTSLHTLDFPGEYTALIVPGAVSEYFVLSSGYSWPCLWHLSRTCSTIPSPRSMSGSTRLNLRCRNTMRGYRFRRVRKGVICGLRIMLVVSCAVYPELTCRLTGDYVNGLECGWGNAMQELFLNAYLAYRTDRS